MDDKAFDAEYRRAVEKAASVEANEPLARSARYDARARRVVVELRNGASFIFPVELAQGLAGASARDLADIRVSPSGTGLHWPRLDADFSLSSLMMGIFGSKAWMAEIGRKDGRPPVRPRKRAVVKSVTRARQSSGKKR
jgi:uncharacterized protein DUF2442